MLNLLVLYLIIAMTSIAAAMESKESDIKEKSIKEIMTLMPNNTHPEKIKEIIEKLQSFNGECLASNIPIIKELISKRPDLSSSIVNLYFTKLEDCFIEVNEKFNKALSAETSFGDKIATINIRKCGEDLIKKIEAIDPYLRSQSTNEKVNPIISSKIEEKVLPKNITLNREEILKNFSVNLLWVYKDSSALSESSYIFPEKIPMKISDTETKNVNMFELLDQWAQHYPVVMHYDGKKLGIHSAEKIVNQTIKAIEEKCKYAKNIELRDIRAISTVTEYSNKYPRLLDKDPNFYFMVDWLRVAIMYDKLKNSSPNTFAGYFDISVKPMNPENLIDDITVKNLNDFGIVMAKPFKGSGISWENGAQILSNNKNLLDATKLVFLDWAPDATQWPLKKWCSPKDLNQMIYNMYSSFFKLFYTLQGKAELTKETNGKIIKYSDLKSGDPLRENMDYWLKPGLLDYHWALHVEYDPLDEILKVADPNRGANMHDAMSVFVPLKAGLLSRKSQFGL